jgi:hypothetical protein
MSSSIDRFKKSSTCVNSVDELSFVKEMSTLVFYRGFADWANKASSGTKWLGC